MLHNIVKYAALGHALWGMLTYKHKQRMKKLEPIVAEKFLYFAFGPEFEKAFKDAGVSDDSFNTLMVEHPKELAKILCECWNHYNRDLFFADYREGILPLLTKMKNEYAKFAKVDDPDFYGIL
jgi:hypothetical protein